MQAKLEATSQACSTLPVGSEGLKLLAPAGCWLPWPLQLLCGPPRLSPAAEQAAAAAGGWPGCCSRCANSGKRCMLVLPMATSTRRACTTLPSDSSAVQWLTPPEASSLTATSDSTCAPATGG
jgi:hypothetical protein